MRAWARDCWQAWLAGGLLAIVAVFFAGPALVPLVVPMSRYYELRTVRVSDTTTDVSPALIVDRTIARNFRGRFEIDIMRVEGSEFEVWWECGPHVSEWRTYRPAARLPADLDLDWWMGIPPNRPCPLPPGQYKVVTTIYARSFLGAELSTTRESNTFEVRAMPARPEEE